MNNNMASYKEARSGSCWGQVFYLTGMDGAFEQGTDRNKNIAALNIAPVNNNI